MTLRERFENSDFHRVFNFKTEEAKGRSVLLFNCGFANIANAAITGALYTAFLAENGIDIVRVGIISFIPYLSWILSIFSPWVMSRFPKRQKLIMFNDYLYYICVILATTIMPLFVEDPTAKPSGLPYSSLSAMRPTPLSVRATQLGHCGLSPRAGAI